MKKIISSFLLAAGLGACQTDAPGSPSAATQAAAPAATAAAAYRAPRAPGGVHPDLNGVWQALSTAHYNIEAHTAQAALQMRAGPYVPVPDASVVALGAVGAVPAGVGIVQGDGRIPYTPEALRQRDENRARAVELDPEVKCYLPGVPRANYMDKPFQIFQSEDQVFFLYEFLGAHRNILLNSDEEAQLDSWMGHSVGHWEGDTLVVEVTGLLPDTWLDRSGNIKGPATKVTERWTRTSDHTLRYEATIEDPEVYTRPWKIALNLYKRVGEDAKINQFKCVEFVEELMYGHLRRDPLPGPALERAQREAAERARSGQ